MPGTDSRDGDGFLSRWARRKAEVREGRLPVEPLPPAAVAVPTTPVVQEAPAGPVAPAAAAVVETPPPEASAPPEPPPTLDDVERLGADAHYGRFMQRDVAPDVKNAAMRKLFTDPHFNVMDGLDVYIDDYGIPDPLPPGMLEQLAQGHALGLFDKAPAQEPDSTDSTDATASPADTDTGAATDSPPPAADAAPALSIEHDEDPDLRLQPHDDAGRGGAGAHAVGDPGRER